MSINSSLYEGSVKHFRVRPKRHVLQYRLFSFLIDLSELEALHARLKIFSRNRFNLFTFKDTDFGVPGMSLQSYVESQLQKAGLFTYPSRTSLLCSPRILGYSFNPLSVFFCYDNDNALYATIYEVHNTFGERHTYVLEACQSSDAQWIKQTCEKAMYVSPFVPAQMDYLFNIKPPTERLALSIKVSDEQGVMVGASMQGKRHVLSDARLLRNFIAYPLMSLKVIGGIHYEALKLWLKGVEWFKYVPKSRLYARHSGEQ